MSEGLTQEQLLMWLLADAAGKRSGVSSALGNVDNPILGAIAGGYDPLAGQTQVGGGGGPLWQTWSTTQDPDLQSIIQAIQEGADPYTLSSAVDQIYAARPGGPAFVSTGLDADGVKSLVKDLQKDYTEGTKTKDVFAQAGLSNPIDQYTEETVPLEGEAYKRAQEYAAKIAEATDRAQRLQSTELIDIPSLKDEMKNLSGQKETNWLRTIVESMASPIGGGGNARKRNTSTKEDMAMMKKAAESLDRKRQQRAEQRIERGQSLQELQRLEEEDAAIRRGYLRRLQEEGRTPFGDQTKARLAFYQMLAK